MEFLGNDGGSWAPCEPVDGSRCSLTGIGEGTHRDRYGWWCPQQSRFLPPGSPTRDLALGFPSYRGDIALGE